MPNIFYKIQFKTELEGLNIELKNSKCIGYLIPNRFFFKKDKTTNQKYIDNQFIRTLYSFNKKIILYENYYRYRPSLINPENFSKEEDKEKSKKKFNDFKKNCNQKDIEAFFLKNISEYDQIITYVKKFLESIQTNGIKQLFRLNDNFEILGYIIPYIPIIQSSYANKETYNIELYKFNLQTINIFNNITSKNLKKFGLDNQYFVISLVLDDYTKNNYNIPKLLEICKSFKKVVLWVIDFNELIATVDNISKFKEIISKFRSLDSDLHIYYTGLYSTRLIEKEDASIKNFVRINGYPGLNINIPAIVQRTKRFLFQDNGQFYNPERFSETFLKSSHSLTYNCNCSICKDFGINNFDKSFRFFVDNPINNRDYDRFRASAKKTLETKLKAKQNSFLMKHNFYILDHQLHMEREEFCKLIFNKNLGINNWKKFIL